MAVKPIPDGYHSVTPYLTVQGVSKLFDFVKRAFDAKQTECITRPDGTIGHAEFRIGDSMIMAGEASDQWKAMPAAIYLYVNDTDATYRRALQAGGVSVMEPADQFYGDRNGGVKDPCGNVWWIATHKEDISPDEMKRRAESSMKQKR